MGGLMISLKKSPGLGRGGRSLDKRLDFPDQRCKTPVQAVAITSYFCVWQALPCGQLAATFPH